jgi:hypothetical protein
MKPITYTNATKKAIKFFIVQRYIFLLFIIPFTANAQTGFPVRSFAKIVVNGTTSGGVTIDNTPEQLVFTPIINTYYKPVTPNKTITVTADLTFAENNIPVGSSGNVTFVLTGSFNVQLNGQVNNSIPASPGTYTRTISNISGTYTWN